MFGNFERKVLSEAPLGLFLDELGMHKCSAIGGMDGGGIFVNGILRGIHLGGVRTCNASVCYPLTGLAFHLTILRELFAPP